MTYQTLEWCLALASFSISFILHFLHSLHLHSRPTNCMKDKEKKTVKKFLVLNEQKEEENFLFFILSLRFLFTHFSRNDFQIWQHYADDVWPQNAISSSVSSCPLPPSFRRSLRSALVILGFIPFSFETFRFVFVSLSLHSFKNIISIAMFDFHWNWVNNGKWLLKIRSS